MEIYLIRHADAEPLAPPLENDRDRPLTPAGVEQCKKLTAALVKVGVRLDKIYTSPLLRSHQTAEEMLRNWVGSSPELCLVEALAPGTKPKNLKRFLMSLDGERVALIGHQPDLAEIAGWLIGSKKVQIRLPKAGVIRIDCSEAPNKDGGVLQWLVVPEWM